MKIMNVMTAKNFALALGVLGVLAVTPSFAAGCGCYSDSPENFRFETRSLCNCDQDDTYVYQPPVGYYSPDPDYPRVVKYRYRSKCYYQRRAC